MMKCDKGMLQCCIRANLMLFFIEFVCMFVNSQYLIIYRSLDKKYVNLKKHFGFLSLCMCPIERQKRMSRVAHIFVATHMTQVGSYGSLNMNNFAWKLKDDHSSKFGFKRGYF